LDDPLPNVEKPIAGRLGDIIHPLLRIAKLLPDEAFSGLSNLIESFEEERKEAEAECLAGRIAQALFDLQSEVEKGRLPFEKIREKINEGIDDRYHIAPQTIGRELSTMGIQRKKSGGKKQIVFDEQVLRKIWLRFIPHWDNVPYVPNVPNTGLTGANDGEEKFGNDPIVPDDGKVRDIPKNYSPNIKPYPSMDRDIREEREISPEGSQKRIFSDERMETGTI
jgi:hypothetical protein